MTTTTERLIGKVPETLHTGDKCTQLNYDFKDHSIPKIIGGLIKSWAIQENEQEKSSYPVVTSVKHINEDVIEIKRVIMYHNFHNSIPYPEEIIRIDRSKLSKDNSEDKGLVYEQYLETPLKQDLTRLHSFGLLLKRQILEVDAHKSFQSLKSIQMMSNLFMYKSLQTCNQLNQLLLSDREDGKERNVAFADLRLSEVLELI